MAGYNPSGPILADEFQSPYKEWYVIFTPFFDLTTGHSCISAILDPDKERCAWLSSEDADTYVGHFRKNTPDSIDDLVYDKVGIVDHPGKYVIRVRQPRRGNGGRN